MVGVTVAKNDRINIVTVDARCLRVGKSLPLFGISPGKTFGPKPVSIRTRFWPVSINKQCSGMTAISVGR